MNRKERRAALSGHSGKRITLPVLRQAVSLHLAGKLQEAYPLYRQALEQEPQNPDALHMMGVLADDAGNPQTGAELISQAVRIDPKNAEYQNSLANCLFALDMIEEAAAWYAQSLALKPLSAETHNNLGNALRRLGRNDEAAESYKKAIALKPEYDDPHNNLGLLAKHGGDMEQAIAHFRKAISLNPASAEAHSNLANALREKGDTTEAAEILDRQSHDSAEGWNNAGLVLHDSGRLQEAADAYERAIAMKPDLAEAYSNLGVTLQALHRTDEAIACHRRCLELAPRSVAALVNLGVLYQQTLRTEQALACYVDALRIDESNVAALVNLATALQKLGRNDEALEAFDHAFSLSPDHPWLQGMRLHAQMAAGEWKDYATIPLLSQRLQRGERAATPFSIIALPVPAADQMLCAKLYAGSSFPAAEAPLYAGARKEGKIRIAYLSSDFHDHATAHLMAGVFEQHDKHAFDVMAASFGQDDGSAMRERLKRAFGDSFIDGRNMGDVAIASLLAEKGVDIAIDLKGYTHNNRFGIFAQRGAPLQVSYLGYPGTTGASYIDYVIADRTVITPEIRPHFSESVAYLPDTYQPNDSKRQIAADAKDRTAHGLPAEGFIFCAFNNSYKITPDVFAIWMDILKAVDNSVLWLLDGGETLKKNLRAAAISGGVAQERLVFAARTRLPDHLARHRHAGLFLDNLPCNAHTTASDALWAGLPVLTCAGQTFAGRVATSLLQAVNMPELSVTSLAEYKSTAIRLAQAPQELQALKDRLAGNRATAPLFNTALYTRNLETALRTMHERRLRGLPPQDFDIEKPA